MVVMIDQLIVDEVVRILREEHEPDDHHLGLVDEDDASDNEHGLEAHQCVAELLDMIHIDYTEDDLEHICDLAGVEMVVRLVETRRESRRMFIDPRPDKKLIYQEDDHRPATKKKK